MHIKWCTTRHSLAGPLDQVIWSTHRFWLSTDWRCLSFERKHAQTQPTTQDSLGSLCKCLRVNRCMDLSKNNAEKHVNTLAVYTYLLKRWLSTLTLLKALKSSCISITGTFTPDNSFIWKKKSSAMRKPCTKEKTADDNQRVEPTVWLTPHMNTLSRGSFERKSFTFWLTALNFFLVFVLAAVAIIIARPCQTA